MTSNYRSHIGCKWYGFTDPQSGMDSYVWRLGTITGSDDLIPATDVHHMEEAFVVDTTTVLGFQLPIGQPLFCTVRGYNKAGICIFFIFKMLQCR